jgi:hypothetical protein
MTFKIAGHWEIGYNTPYIEANYWNLALRDFEVGEWLMTPVSGIFRNDQEQVRLIEFNSYEEMLGSCEELPRIFLEPRTSKFNPETVWLHDFTHPKECVYVFGSAHYNPTLNFKREGDEVVTVKTKQDKGVLWSHQVVAIILYDRMIKENLEKGV